MGKMTIITKASGEQTSFDVDKLRRSLHCSNADEETINKIIDEVQKNLYHGMPSKKIYQVAFGLLKKQPKPFAARYRLKRAIMELGPSGFPFERYIAEILKHQGYSVKVGGFIKGVCVAHEVDIIAEKKNQFAMIECKFHHSAGYACDIKIPLYIQSRFKDLEQKWKTIQSHDTKVHQGWVVTNTKFSNDAIQYGLCVGLNLLGWDFPKNNSLSNQVDRAGLYPITCLTTLTSHEKQLLLDRKIVLCKDLCDNPELLSITTIVEARKSAVMDEVNLLSKG